MLNSGKAVGTAAVTTLTMQETHFVARTELLWVENWVLMTEVVDDPDTFSYCLQGVYVDRWTSLLLAWRHICKQRKTGRICNDWTMEAGAVWNFSLNACRSCPDRRGYRVTETCIDSRRRYCSVACERCGLRALTVLLVKAGIRPWENGVIVQRDQFSDSVGIVKFELNDGCEWIYMLQVLTLGSTVDATGSCVGHHGLEELCIWLLIDLQGGWKSRLVERAETLDYSPLRVQVTTYSAALEPI